MGGVDPSGDTALATVSDPSRPTARPSAQRLGRRYAHFQVERLLGQGGMGEVYLATDLALERPVALKFLGREVAGDPRLRERFLREARAQARVSHPNVCHIYYVGEEDGELFFAMEHVDGETVQARIDGQGKLAAADALDVCRQAALGLREAHRHGFTHRDVKPSNLMIDRHGVVKLLDFGIVKEVADPEKDGKVPLTLPGGTTLVGTPHYMAPEQAKGERIDFRADVYALGATLHHLLTGHPPFEGTTAMAVVSMHLSEPRPAIRKRGWRASSTLDELCDRMMAKRPEGRFAGYDELLEAIGRVFREPAGIWPRAQALFMDAILVGLVSGGLATLYGLATGRPQGELAEAISHVLVLAYVVGCLARWGRTLGKAALGIEVVSIDGGGPLGLRRSLVRYLWGSIVPYAFLGVFWLTGKDFFQVVAYGSIGVFAVFARLRPDRRTFWDLRARTIVLKKRRAEYRPEA